VEAQRGGTGLMRLFDLQNRLYDRLRHREAFRAAAEPGSQGDLSALEGHKYCLVATFRRNGEPVPTPVWFGLSEGRAYVRTGAGVGKVKRVRANPRVTVAPYTVRGKPLGPTAEGRARILPASEEARAEAALEANYGLGRRVYERTAGSLGEAIYLEISPAP
jgi:PPOX class probable F420-dependent enzyme